MRILHLSDLHLTATGSDEDGVSSSAALAGLLHDLRHLPPVDLVVVSGDVTDDGTEGGYADALTRVGGRALAHGAGSVFTTGNHDVRGAFTASLGSGHHDAHGNDVGVRGPGCAAVSTHSGLRVVGLDTLVPGSVHGRLGDDQLAWLREELATPARSGTVVVLHHPPTGIAGIPAQAEVLLHDPADLAAALTGSDVRLLLCGHLHHQLASSLAGVPVWVSPGVVTRADLTSPPHLLRAVLGAGASVHELGADPASPVTSYVVQARDPRAGEEVYVCDPAIGEDATED